MKWVVVLMGILTLTVAIAASGCVGQEPEYTGNLTVKNFELHQGVPSCDLKNPETRISILPAVGKDGLSIKDFSIKGYVAVDSMCDDIKAEYTVQGSVLEITLKKVAGLGCSTCINGTMSVDGSLSLYRDLGNGIDTIAFYDNTGKLVGQIQSVTPPGKA
ncbi:MAG: hypothetical protein HY362_02550 [Candidatus Aenigmarchaeota archaeon]|nr:hypothetical protein [Candidatus Aenigmarchaeota archaeon]